MRIINFISLILIAWSIHLTAADWTPTNGPKKNGSYIPVYSIEKLSNTTFVVGTDGGGIYKTTNSGSTWTNVFSNIGLTYKIEKQNNGTLWASTDYLGIYRSTNNGDSWTKVFDLSSLAFEISFDDLGNIYLGAEAFGLFKSTNNGSTWELIWETDFVPSAILYKDGILYVGTLSDGVYYSDDEGQTFNPLEFGGEIIWDIVDVENTIYVLSDNSGIFKSTDGINFEHYAFSNSSVREYMKSSINSTEYLIVDGGIYRKVSGNNNWESFNDGIPNEYDIYSLEEDSEGFLLAVTSGAGAYKSLVSNLEPEILSLGNVNTNYCAGEFFNISYTVQGGFASNNNFRIQLSDKNGSFTNPTVIGSTQSQTSGSMDVVIPYNSLQGTNYQVRIVSTNPAIIGPNSELFTINELSTNLNAPANQMTDVILKPTFTWTANDCALNYSLQISKLANFSSIEYQFDGLSNNSYTLEDNLEKGTTYYWRVILLSNLGDELYSSAFSFTTLNTVTQVLNLSAGWNLVSSYITIDNMNITNYLSSITDQILIAKNPAGLTYIPEYEINQIGNWNNAHAYQIYMKSAQSIDLVGDAIIPENYIINLNNGWNRIGYTRNSNLSAITAFAQLTDNDNLLIAKNLTGLVYIPSFGINTLGNLIPGQGYMIYVTSADSFSYPAN